MPEVSLNGIEFEIKGSADGASASVRKLTAFLNSLRVALNRLFAAKNVSATIRGLGVASKLASSIHITPFFRTA